MTVRRRWAALCLAAAVSAATAFPAFADERGVSFWLPGQYGSLAAVGQQPGWVLVSAYYHATVTTGANVAAAYQVAVGRFTTSANVNLNANLKANADFAIFAPSYVFAPPVLGGQLALGVTAIAGRLDTTINSTASASLGPLAILRSGSISDTSTAFGDLYPQASLRWNAGVHNFMTYVSGDVPVGSYSSSNLSNIGIGHGAIDAGGGYTYFDPQRGHEFSAVGGFTYNFTNNETNYRNGTDFHLDWGASQFLSKQLHVGAVGYFYRQLSADIGQPAFLGDMKSRVTAVGPQIGYVFPAGTMQGYVNVKAYKEFASSNRPEGWNAWLTFVISQAPGGPLPNAQPRPMITK